MRPLRLTLGSDQRAAFPRMRQRNAGIRGSQWTLIAETPGKGEGVELRLGDCLGMPPATQSA